MFNTILFPLDRSREAQEAIAVVVDIVQKYQSKLILLSVVETPNLDGEIIIEESGMQSPEAIQELLTGAQELFSKRGIEAEVLQREGNPPFVICDVADELDVDLIVMGSRGIGLDAERTTESVAHRTIDLCPCPVLIVP
jgi:nucleotide-binding universal stress UspA family protein